MLPVSFSRKTLKQRVECYSCTVEFAGLAIFLVFDDLLDKVPRVLFNRECLWKALHFCRMTPCRQRIQQDASVSTTAKQRERVRRSRRNQTMATDISPRHFNDNDASQRTSNASSR